MFVSAATNIVTEPKWMVGIEWDMINLIRDIYCRLVLGQTLQAGGQGPGMQQPRDLNNPRNFEQAKTVEQPLQGGGILTVPCNTPRNLLARLPGIGVGTVEQLEQNMTAKRAAKDQVGAMQWTVVILSADCLNLWSASERFSPRPASGGRREHKAVGQNQWWYLRSCSCGGITAQSKKWIWRSGSRLAGETRHVQHGKEEGGVQQGLSSRRTCCFPSVTIVQKSQEKEGSLHNDSSMNVKTTKGCFGRSALHSSLAGTKGKPVHRPSHPSFDCSRHV
mmetsp:Transcript_4625/g.10388  ORF Transcript_4625/g.10388 Transcript_4625/m.10388 type:complete len:277 (-) Transcript_4625:762-1592(-)